MDSKIKYTLENIMTTISELLKVTMLILMKKKKHLNSHSERIKMTMIQLLSLTKDIS